MIKLISGRQYTAIIPTDGTNELKSETGAVCWWVDNNWSPDGAEKEFDLHLGNPYDVPEGQELWLYSKDRIQRICSGWLTMGFTSLVNSFNGEELGPEDEIERIT